jgi:hypothetical protein
MNIYMQRHYELGKLQALHVTTVSGRHSTYGQQQALSIIPSTQSATGTVIKSATGIVNKVTVTTNEVNYRYSEYGQRKAM